LLLTPGEFARVRLVVGAPAPRLLVPDTAVLPDQSQHVVMTVSPDDMVVPKHVEISEIRDGLRVIRSGLTPNDKVIIDGIPSEPARVLLATPPTPAAWRYSRRSAADSRMYAPIRVRAYPKIYNHAGSPVLKL
jgi:multidrug efflux pump subunit AcrA (membrane-fusion protein)